MSEHNLNVEISANFAVLTTSDSRNKETDVSGKIANELIKRASAGHKILDYRIIKNDSTLLKTTINKFLENQKINVVITIGGTGISKRDVTVQTINEILDRKIEGFGELFRHLSYQEIGEAAMISRATAGTINGKLIFCLPGSKNAVKLALQKLVLPALGHMLTEANR
ncbi:MAG: MogA/MoaB family molybdenum cofactor biosynthesis protein [Candidatus Bathyarchaeota archaeon]|jgi:molybdenum cofactor biosynthesis protein B